MTVPKLRDVLGPAWVLLGIGIIVTVRLRFPSETETQLFLNHWCLWIPAICSLSFGAWMLTRPRP